MIVKSLRDNVGRLTVAFLLTIWGSACGTSDEAAPGPDGFADASVSDTSTDTLNQGDSAGDAVAQGQLDFYLVLKSGNALKSSNSVILATTQDKYPDADFQADLVVTSPDLADGTEVSVTIGGVALGTTTLTAGSAELKKITIPCASVAQDIVATAGSASKTKSALVNCTNACAATLTKPDACSTKDADPAKPGFQVALEVNTTTPDCSHAFIKYTDESGKAGESEKVLLNGQSKVTIVVTLSSKDASLVNATAQVQAIVEDQAFPTRPKGTSPQETVKMTTEAPVLVIAQPASDKLSLADDANGNAADGIQVNVVGTATTMLPLEPVEITVNGTSVGNVNIGAGGTSFQTTLTFDKSEAYKIEVKATNSCGLSGSTDKTVTAFVDKASLVISKPTPNEVLLAKDDGDVNTPNIFETQMIVTVAKAVAGDKISVFCRPNSIGSVYGTSPVGTAVYQAGASGVSIAASLALADLTTAVVCRASIDGANPTNSGEMSFTVGLPAPCLQISQPLENGAIAGVSLPVSATSSGLEGRVVEAKLALKGGATFIDAPVGKIANNVMSVNLSLQVGNPAAKLPDGTYILTLSASDTFGNAAADSACSDLTRTIVLDSSAPKLSITAPTKASLDPVVDADSDATTPGYQTDVAVAVSGETGETTVCLKVNAFSQPCQKLTGAGSITFSGVSLQPGANAVVVSGTDALGNKTTNPAKTVTLVSNAVVVTWDDPKTDSFIAADTTTVKAKISKQTDASPIAGAKVVVQVNGVSQPAIAVTEAPAGVYSATIAGLKTGKNTLQFIATPATGGIEGVSPLLTITRKVGKPTVTIASPADKTTFNATSSACVGGVTNCSTTVTTTVGNAADGSKVDLVVTCGTQKQTFSGVVASGKASIAQVVFTHGTSCTAVATVTDEAQQTADSAPISVTTDRVAPKLASLNPSQTNFTAADDLNANPSDQLQLLLTVNASGLAENAAVSLEIFDDDGKKVKTYTSSDHSAINDTSFGKIGFGAVTLPDGLKVKLVLKTTDAAGNAASLETVVKVVVNAPDVRIGQPPYTAPTACSATVSCASGVCVAGKCATPWNKQSVKTVGIATVGLLPGATARVCSNNSALSGNGACATPGYNLVGAASPIPVGGGTLQANLPDGKHTVIVEVLPAGKDANVAANWVSSTKTPLGATLQSRDIAVDTVLPSLKSVLAPSVAGVPSGCLSAASQTKLDNVAGGTFSFAATLDNEDSVISIFVNGSKVGSADSVNKLAGIAVTLSAGSAALKAVAVDVVGNESAPFTVGTFNVNTVAPIGQFVQPNKGVLVVGDSRDVNVSSQSSDVEGQAVVLKDAGKTIGTLSMSKGLAAFAHATYKTLSDGSHTLTAELKDVCGNTATIGTVPSTILVDTAAPTVTIATPTAKQSFGDNGDADAATGGYQVALTFGSNGGDSWTAEIGSECDASFKNCAGFSQAASGKVTNDGGNEPSVLLTVPFGKTDNFVARVSVTDSNGNKTTVTREFSVKLSGCKVLVTGLPSSGVLNTQACSTKGSDCASIKLPLQAEFLGPCGSVSEVQFLKGGSVVGKVTPANSKASFTMDINDGDDTKVEVQVIAAGKSTGTSGASALRADFSNPKAAFIAGTVASFTTAASGTTATYGPTADQDVGKNGIQIQTLLEVVDTNVIGGAITSLKNGSADLSSSLTLPTTLAGSNGKATVEVKFVSLGDDATSKIEASVSDSAGNVAVAVLDVITDSTKPGTLVLDPIDKTKLNPRRPSAVLTFKAVGDNGSTGAAAAKYEVRYSKSEITNETDFEKACDAGDLSATTIGKPKAPGTADLVVIEGPDGRALSDACKFSPLTDNGASSWYFAVRTVDLAGNKGAISNAVSTKDLRMRFAKVTGTVAPYNNKFMYALPRSVGDVNGDGKMDFAVRGGINVPFCVVYGAAGTDGTMPDVDIKVKSASTHTCWIESQFMGQGVADFIDVNGDGVQDLVADYGHGVGVAREVRIYLGEKGKPITTTAAVTLKNINNSGFLGVESLASIGNFTGDESSSSNPVQDFAFKMGPTTAQAYDKVVVVPGNTAWSTSSPVTIDVTSAADRAKYNFLTIYRTDFSGTPNFGSSLGGHGNFLPDATGTQYDDLVITQYNAQQSLFIVKGRAVSGDTTLTLTAKLTGAGSADATSICIHPDAATGLRNPKGPVKVSFDGDTIDDLLFTHTPTSNQAVWFYWLRGKTLAANLGKEITLKNTAVAGVTGLSKHAFGYAASPANNAYAYPVRAAGNFFDQSGSGAVAIAYTQNMPPNAAKRIGVRAPIVRASGTGTEASYHMEDLSITHPYTSGGSDLGLYDFNHVGDVNGDGYPDLIVGTTGGYAILVY